MTLHNFIEHLASKGKYTFSVSDALKATNLSLYSFRSSIHRLKKHGLVSSPCREFFLIIPPEYRSLGSLPPDQFIGELMRYFGQPYYVACLSAAHYYGATDQQPQTFQVVTTTSKRQIIVERVKIAFITNSKMEKMPTKQLNTPRGYLTIATPEVTAIDVISYPRHSGGLSNAYDVISELSEQIELDTFSKVIKNVTKAPYLQRLGYIFERLGHHDLAKACAKELKKFDYVRKTLLDPQESSSSGRLEQAWNLIINLELEVEDDS